MDEIRIDNLQIFAHHGVYPEETQKGQNFYINAVLYTDTHAGGLADDLSLTTNYGQVCQFLHDYLTQNTWKLLEAAVEHAARALLLQFPLISALELELRKPEAPIPLPFQSVSVRIRRGWHKAYIALGSNLGDKEGYLRQALEAMESDPHLRVKAVSSFLVTPPYGGVEQDDFLNGAVEVDTLLTPQELLARLHEIEQAANRQRVVHWGPRTLDLDILFYDDLVLRTPELTVPHPDLQNRTFVLEPMAEIAPQLLHPLLHKTAAQLLAELQEKG